MNDATVKPNGAVHALPQAEDQRAVDVRDMLLGCSTMGFVGAVVIGLRPRNTGFSVIGSSDLDALRLVGALEVAKRDAMSVLTSGPMPAPQPPKGGA